ncbi:MAG: lipid-A-disaccharide synthase [Planctomycetota bacterium]|nr:lipid-A-disaccharide synthase [Planctomycetota bacterium]
MKIFFSVGEPSGDLHGSNLILELKRHAPDIECVGFGGPRMQAAGCELLFDLTQFAVMFFVRVLLNLHKFVALAWQAEKYFKENEVEAVVLIDYPGFNWAIAKRARRHGIPVYYYGVPQLWAWAPWRIRKMRRNVSYALCKLPFEEKWYRDRGCEAKYVGHPFFDELVSHQSDKTFISDMQNESGPLVTILPGSRTQEVETQLPWFLKSAELIKAQVPEVRFAVAAFKESQAEFARNKIVEAGMDVEVYTDRTPELMQAADCCMACSGSVSLELMYHRKPTVVLYYMSKSLYRYAKFMVNVRYMTLVNLIASSHPFEPLQGSWHPDDPDCEDIPMPEYPTCADKSAEVAEHVVEWLSDSQSYDESVAQLAALSEMYGHPGASQRAAVFILESLTGKSLTSTKSAA